MSDSGTYTVSNSQLVIATYKPRIVEMHTREHLDRFMEQAEATGVGLGWLQWRFSIEIGSATYLELLRTGEISQARHGEIVRELGLVPTRVKQEPEEDTGMKKLAQLARELGVKVDYTPDQKVEAGLAPAPDDGKVDDGKVEATATMTATTATTTTVTTTATTTTTTATGAGGAQLISPRTTTLVSYLQGLCVC
jgi:hypothetical protein